MPRWGTTKDENLFSEQLRSGAGQKTIRRIGVGAKHSQNQAILISQQSLRMLHPPGSLPRRALSQGTGVMAGQSSAGEAFANKTWGQSEAQRKRFAPTLTGSNPNDKRPPRKSC
ncbi:MAG: hypothetical protein HYX94_08640 [Chloroflexi bacterium]|nr:hypothetical protein [Chloroflexota bacterium]